MREEEKGMNVREMRLDELRRIEGGREQHQHEERLSFTGLFSFCCFLGFLMDSHFECKPSILGVILY